MINISNKYIRCEPVIYFYPIDEFFIHFLKTHHLYNLNVNLIKILNLYPILLSSETLL